MNPSISLDFGAAYTKIAVRDEPSSRSRLLFHEDLSLDPDHVCIPSVAAYRESDGRWEFGADAVDLVEGEGIHVFKNWKPSLFEEREEWIELDPSPLSPEDVGFPDSRVVTEKFFEWLHQNQFPKMMGGEVLEDPLVRISIPEFALHTPEASDFEELVAKVGWDTEGPICFSEPLTNLMGALSQGRNSVQTDDRGRMFPKADEIFAQSDLMAFVEELRRDAEGGEWSGHYVFLLIDVGAFTADYGLVSIDVESHGYFPLCETHSEALGIGKLDRLVQRSLSEEKRLQLQRLSARDSERFRRTVYGTGEPWRLGDVVIGDDTDGKTISNCIHAFSDRIGEGVEKFLERFQAGHLDEVIFTGGGSNIPALIDRLGTRLGAQRSQGDAWGSAGWGDGRMPCCVAGSAGCPGSECPWGSVGVVRTVGEV